MLKACGTAHFERAVNFYKNMLGLSVLRTWGDGVKQGIMLSTGSGIIEIFANAAEQKPQGSIQHFALACTDVDECVKRVREAGYEITVEPKDVCISSAPPFPIRIAFCVGPVGEEIEFFCEK